MKLVICAFIVLVGPFGIFAQTKGIQITQYSYAVHGQDNNWHWLSGSYQYRLSEKWSGAVGLGFNITPLFREQVYHFEPYPGGKIAGRFNIHLQLQRTVAKPLKNVSCYVFDKVNFNHTSFDKTTATVVGELVYFRNTTTPPGLLIDNTLGVGLDVYLWKNISLVTKAGISWYYLQDISVGKPGFAFCNEFGFHFAL
jgi:hypothetical protein